MTPRFQGVAIENEDGSWSWELKVTSFGQDDDAVFLGTENNFQSKDLALEDLMSMVQFLCEEYQKDHGLEVGRYVDLKSNETLNWNRKKTND